MLIAQASKLRSISTSLAIVMVLAMVAFVDSSSTKAEASYLSVNPGVITYNDRVCNLGDPANHVTSETAFEISSSAQLWEITDCVSTSATIHFKLADDIDVSDASKSGSAPTISPIGLVDSTNFISFSGVLEGGNHTISGLEMSSATRGVGLFALLDGATIRNLALSGEFATTYSTENVYRAAGALAIMSKTLVTLDSVSGTVTVAGAYNVGGLIGYVDGEVIASRISTSGSVEGRDQVGGFFGYVDDSLNISDSSNRSDVQGQMPYGIRVGGLVGYAAGSTSLSSVHNFGNVDGSLRVGGLIGDVLGTLEIRGSSNHGEITHGVVVGGLVGIVGVATIIDSTNTGTVSSSITVVTDSFVAGLVASANTIHITGSTNDGLVSGARELVGGLVGSAATLASISGSVNQGKVTSTAGQRVGGMVGLSQNAWIGNSENSGDVSAVHRVGGLVGAVASLTVDDFTNSASVSGVSFVGGVAGEITNYANSTKILNEGRIHASASGLVESSVGGLFGSAQGATVIESTNKGAIIAQDAEFVGGLIGFVNGNGANLSGVINRGSVLGRINVGGLVGIADGITTDAVTISNSVNLGDLVAGGQAGGLVGLSLISLVVRSSVNFGDVTVTSYRGSGIVMAVAFSNNSSKSFSIQDTANFGRIEAQGNRSAGILISALNAPSTASNILRTANFGQNVTPSLVDGILMDPNGAVQMAHNYSLADSNYSPGVTAQGMRDREAYDVSWDFDTLWGFGTCEEFDGFPTPRALGLVPTYYSDGCYTAPVPSAPQAIAPAPVYSGPILNAGEARAGSKLTLTGSRLSTVTEVFAGDTALSIVSVDGTKLVLELPASLLAGNYDLIVKSSFGSLSIQDGLRVLEPVVNPGQALGSEEAINQKLSVGSFKGVVAIFTKGYEGQRLSAKIAGKWLVVPELRENWKGGDISRAVRKVRVGQTIKVQLFIDRVFVRTEELTTR